MPKISVIIPAYNPNSEHFEEALDSILSQTYTDFEILLLDDSSNFVVEEVIKKYYDARIKYIKNTPGIGLVASLNKGIELAEGEYIARMDTDDISLPERFEKQVTFLEKNPDISIVGANIEFFGNREHITNYALNHDEIKIQLLFGCAFAHPLVMFRKKDFVENDLWYSQDFDGRAEDYEFWTRVIRRLKGANLPEILLNYRTHDQQGMILHSEQVIINDIKIKLQYLKNISIELNEEEKNVFDRMLKGRFFNQLSEALNLIEKIINNNKQFKFFNQKNLEQHFINLIKYTIENCPVEVIKIFPILEYFNTELGWKISFKEKLRILFYVLKNKLVCFLRNFGFERLENFIKFIDLRKNHEELFEKIKKGKFKVLIISHELSFTGAPITLINLSEIIKENGGEVVIYSLKSGKLKKTFEDMDIPVIVDENLSVLNYLLKYFDISFVNTVASYKAIPIINKKIPYIWWIHESLLLDIFIEKNPEIKNALEIAPKIYTVSDTAKSFITKYHNKIELLTYGIKDVFEKYQKYFSSNTKITFCMVGTINPVKGQDIFVDAILKLPKAIRQKAVFEFIGKATDYEFYNNLIRKTKDCQEIIFEGSFSPEDTLKKVINSDVLVCSSRGDSFGIVVQEALMLGKLCVVSSQAGISDWFVNSENGFVFDCEDIDALSSTLEKIIENPLMPKEFFNKSREMYLSNFTYDIFKQNVEAIIQNELGRHL